MNLIPNRIEELKSISVLAAARMGWDRQNFAHVLHREDMQFWASQPDGELRPDTTGKVSMPLAEACAKLIRSCLP